MSVGTITAAGLSVADGEHALIQDLNLHARAGKVLGITGASGSGKTTLLYAVGGLIPAATGELLIDGRPLVLWRDAAAGIIFQNLALVPVLSAQETVALPLQARGLTKVEIAERSLSALAALGLADHAAQLVGDLSGGQRQRVAVARALSWHPDVILADEPTSALDTHWRQVVLDLLRAEAAHGAVVIIASSDPEVTAICDEVVTLRR
ncbi:MAG: ABC transporter ATP-binding protein [Candidatus Woesearchaeota archaeon]